MTDKQIMIDGVDVSGCGWYTQGATRMICADWHISNDCSKNPNCYYKQLKRAEQTVEECHKYQVQLEDKLEAKEQECEKLKKQLTILDDEDVVVEITVKQFEEYKKLKQTLTEIKEMCKEEKGWVNCSDMKLTETAQFAQQIFDKISEAENG